MGPRRARWLCAAMKPRVVQTSSIGWSSESGAPICQKWSMTQIESKPTSSAVRTARARVGPMASVPPGQVNE